MFMTKIISLFNQKGGVGKTTTAVNLSACLTKMGKKVLGIDLDPQSNFTSGLDIDRTTLENSTYDIIVNEMDAADVVIKTEVENLDLIPSSIDLASAEIEIAGRPKRETILKRGIKSIVNNYDYVIIDCAPSLGLLPVNALCASNSVLIPIQCEYYALEGLTQLLNTIKLTQNHFNKKLSIEGLLLTMLDQRTNLGLEVSQEVRKYFKEKVYKTVIPRNIKLSEAPSAGICIFDYDSSSVGAQAYKELAKEVLSRNG